MLDTLVPHIVLAAGGSGGHISPALALAESLRAIKPGIDLTFLCGDKPFERRMIEAAGHSPRIVAARPFVMSSPVGLAKGIAGATGAFLMVRQWLSAISPSVVVGMGGYVAAPSILAARTLGVPTYLHEQNAIPGRANRLLSRVADRTTAAHPNALTYLHGSHRRYLANPLQRHVLTASREEGYRHFKLSPDRPVILVLGGSQGSARLNELIWEAGVAMANNLPIALVPQILWIAGEAHAEKWMERVAATTMPTGVFRIHAFTDRLSDAYAAADVAVARSGAGTLAELAAMGLPSILVPYPHARDDHQTANASEFDAAGAAIVKQESELTSDALVRMLTRLLAQPALLTKMAAAARILARPDAAFDMARLVLDLADRRPRTAPAAESSAEATAMAV